MNTTTRENKDPTERRKNRNTDDSLTHTGWSYRLPLPQTPDDPKDPRTTASTLATTHDSSRRKRTAHASLKMLGVVAVLSLWSGKAAAQDTSIRLRQGTVQGIVTRSNHRPIYAYLGIPYAKPPVNELRFKPPERHEGWSATLYAKAFEAACPQPFLTGVQTSEDCLTLNVWIPEPARGFRAYPVVVVLEGELFVTSSPSRFPGQDLAAVDVIVVTVNYRTNAFGFLSWEDAILPGNLGLRDQSLALQWVAENIDKFGGDLKRITLLGHSAGAASVAYHLVHPRGQGPFQQVILLSGSNLAPWALCRRPRAAARRLAEHLGCGLVSGSSFLLDCLLVKDVNQIVKGVERLIEEGNPNYLFGPVIDTFLQDDGKMMVPLEPLSSIRENANRRIPVLTGLSDTDGSVMLYIKREITHMTYDDLSRYGHEILVPLLTSLAGINYPAVNRMIEYAYLDKAPPGSRSDLVLEIVKMFTDGMFKTPVVQFAREVAKRGLTTYLFVNEFNGPDVYDSHTNLTGAQHGSEMGYLFSPAALQPIINRPLTVKEDFISQNLKRAIYSFASNKRPTLWQYSPVWEKFLPETPFYAAIASSQILRNYQHHQIAFWNDLLPNLASLTATSPATTPTGTQVTTPTTGIGRPVTGTQIITAGPTDKSYEPAVWALVAVILLLVAAIVCYVVCSRRRQMLASGTLSDQ
ncbi:acetylcholinesterase-like isoform X1 [Penaeus indicus]|uniref:acetylcholinesterase-like isoform X1 n=1 Tax=Penaeus indicus TaxID=29960 RepID=UPI00300CE787